MLGKIGRYLVALTGVLVVLFAIGAVVYWAAFRPVDDLAVVMTGGSELRPLGKDPKQPRFAVSAAHTMTFVNGGRRSAAVVSVKLVVVDAPPEATCDNLGEATLGATEYDYDFEPLVVPAREMAVRTVRLRQTGQEPPMFEPMFGNEDFQRMRLLSCAVFHVVGQGRSLTVPVRVGDDTIGPDGDGAGSYIAPTEMRSLLRHRGSLRVK